jgi:hypothetical protein
MKIVIENGGNIDYKIPRSGKSHKDEFPTYIPKKKEKNDAAVIADGVGN